MSCFFEGFRLYIVTSLASLDDIRCLLSYASTRPEPVNGSRYSSTTRAECSFQKENEFLETGSWTTSKRLVQPPGGLATPSVSVDLPQFHQAEVQFVKYITDFLISCSRNPKAWSNSSVPVCVSQFHWTEVKTLNIEYTRCLRTWAAWYHQQLRPYPFFGFRGC